MVKSGFRDSLFLLSSFRKLHRIMGYFLQDIDLTKWIEG